MIFSNVDQRAVRIGQLDSAVRAFLQQCEPGGTFRVEIERLWGKMYVSLGDLVDIGRERFEVWDPEADMVHSGLFDPSAIKG
jgi:hypothetical protein